MTSLLEDISPETLVYAVLALLVYSAVLIFMLGRFGQARADLRESERAEINANLSLMHAMRRVREDIADGDQLAEFDVMWARLLTETSGRINSLNNAEEVEVARPHRRYLILPAPRTAFGAVMSLIFALAAYAGIGAFLLGGILYANREIDPVNNPADLEFAVKYLGAALLLIGGAFVARFLAYQSYKLRLSRDARLAERVQTEGKPTKPKKPVTDKRVKRAAEKAAASAGKEAADEAAIQAAALTAAGGSDAPIAAKRAERPARPTPPEPLEPSIDDVRKIGAAAGPGRTAPRGPSSPVTPPGRPPGSPPAAAGPAQPSPSEQPKPSVPSSVPSTSGGPPSSSALFGAAEKPASSSPPSTGPLRPPGAPPITPPITPPGQAPAEGGPRIAVPTPRIKPAQPGAAPTPPPPRKPEGES